MTPRTHPPGLDPGGWLARTDEGATTTFRPVGRAIVLTVVGIAAMAVAINVVPEDAIQLPWACSLSEGDQGPLADRLTERLSDSVVAIGSTEVFTSPTVTAPGSERNYAFDQGPHRVCASGSVAVDTPYGEARIIVRAYDSASAADAMIGSNVRGTSESRGAPVCARAGGDGECYDYALQLVDESVSIVVSSSEMTTGELRDVADEVRKAFDRR